jgi:hypothetical protein
MEKVGEAISQTIAGLILDVKKLSVSDPKGNNQASQTLLRLLLILNVAHLWFVLCLWMLQKKKQLHEPEESVYLPTSRRTSRVFEANDTEQVEQQRLLEGAERTYSPPSSIIPPTTRLPDLQTPEVRRGRLFARISMGLLGIAWVLFLGTAWLKLRSKADRSGQ